MKKIAGPDAYFDQLSAYREPMLQLREIVLTTGLKEELKWGIPCYSHNGDLVVGIAAFKSYFGLWFYQGGLLNDPAQKLLNAQEGRTKAMRQMRFQSDAEIDAGLIQAYIRESIDNFNHGLKITADRSKPLELPEELNAALSSDPDMKSRFEKMSLTNKRDFAEHIAAAKRAETRAARLEKVLDMVRRGVGLNDQYK